eukprot:scaffold770_cov255-Pinguiococcus_pyrenoidosus.AAC.74
MSTRPVWLDARPGVQLVHSNDSAASAYVPGWHTSHAVWPVEFVADPAAQGSHGVLRDVSLLNRPLAQASQEPLLLSCEYRPASQEEQATAPSVEYSPAVQLRQRLTPSHFTRGAGVCEGGVGVGAGVADGAVEMAVLSSGAKVACLAGAIQLIPDCVALAVVRNGEVVVVRMVAKRTPPVHVVPGEIHHACVQTVRQPRNVPTHPVVSKVEDPQVCHPADARRKSAGEIIVAQDELLQLQGVRQSFGDFSTDVVVRQVQVGQQRQIRQVRQSARELVFLYFQAEKLRGVWRPGCQRPRQAIVPQNEVLQSWIVQPRFRDFANEIIASNVNAKNTLQVADLWRQLPSKIRRRESKNLKI